MSDSQSSTPRTDSEVYDRLGHETIDVNFARKLERDLADCQAKLAQTEAERDEAYERAAKVCDNFYGSSFDALAGLIRALQRAEPREPLDVCDVCGNSRNADGILTHGKGCYVLSEDGGGEEYIGPPKEYPLAPAAPMLPAEPNAVKDLHYRTYGSIANQAIVSYIDLLRTAAELLAKDAARWKWAKLILSGDGGPEANARTLGIAAELMAGKDVDTATDAAMGVAAAIAQQEGRG